MYMQTPQYIDDLQSFVWEIPTSNRSHIDLLCHGYIRSHFHNSAVLNNMINVCVDYLNMETEIMHKIKHAIPGQAFYSPTFYTGKLKWKIEIYPNGYD